MTTGFGGRQVGAVVLGLLIALVALVQIVLAATSEVLWVVTKYLDGWLWTEAPMMLLSLLLLDLGTLLALALGVAAVIAVTTRRQGWLTHVGLLSGGVVVATVASYLFAMVEPRLGGLDLDRIFWWWWGGPAGWLRTLTVLLALVALALHPWRPTVPRPVGAAAHPARGPGTADHFHVAVAGTAHGPYPLTSLRQFVQEGRVTPDTPLSIAHGAWQPARQVPGLFAAPPPPPVQG